MNFAQLMSLAITAVDLANKVREELKKVETLTPDQSRELKAKLDELHEENMALSSRIEELTAPAARS